MSWGRFRTEQPHSRSLTPASRGYSETRHRAPRRRRLSGITSDDVPSATAPADSDACPVVRRTPPLPGADPRLSATGARARKSVVTALAATGVLGSGDSGLTTTGGGVPVVRPTYVSLRNDSRAPDAERMIRRTSLCDASYTNDRRTLRALTPPRSGRPALDMARAAASSNALARNSARCRRHGLNERATRLPLN